MRKIIRPWASGENGKKTERCSNKYKTPTIECGGFFNEKSDDNI
jgi:hypothetical protein